MLQSGLDAEAAGRALTGGDSTPPIETLDALRAGLEVGSASRTRTVTLADFERYHQVSWSCWSWSGFLVRTSKRVRWHVFPERAGAALPRPVPGRRNLIITSVPSVKGCEGGEQYCTAVVAERCALSPCLLRFPLTRHGVV